MSTVWVLVLLLVGDNYSPIAQTHSVHEMMDQCFEMRELVLNQEEVNTFEKRATHGIQAVCVARKADYF